MKKNLLYAIMVLGVLGLLTSIYLINEHYSSDASVCDFNEVVSCSLVNSSVFSEILNVPIALFGALWFVILIFMAWKALKKNEVLSSLLLWNILGILFVVYLIIAEFILQALCPFCTIVHLITLITFLISFVLYRKNKKTSFAKSIKKWIALIVILNLIPLVIFNFPTGSKENHDVLAKCITEKGVNMYGSFRCGICAKTRAKFGDSFQYINEIECHPQGENSQTELCLSIGIEGTPTWILEPNGVEQKRNTGFLSIEELREFSGCTE